MSPDASLVDRVRQLLRLWSKEGIEGITHRIRIRIANAAAPPGSGTLPIGDAEFAAAAALSREGWRLPRSLAWSPGEPLKIGWVCTPPAPWSGGHTTMFRLVQSLISAGHQCTVYLIDNHEWDLRQHIARIRQGWPNMTAEVKDFRDGVDDSHAIFATGWDSAWTLLRSPALGLRCYLVQDFEPSFYPAGSEYLLAEATYRFGFRGVTAGKWLPEILRTNYEMDATGFDFGCDLDRYFLKPKSLDRSGICYYCRPHTPRRAHELGLAALHLFAQRNPGIPIHFYGSKVGDVGFPVTQHGVLTPEELNELYNECVAGLVLSATNISLVPQEMLASGCIPVVNDAEHNRMVLNNRYVRYTPATPFQLANTLEEIVRRSPMETAAGAAACATSVTGRTWDTVGQEFNTIVEGFMNANGGTATSAIEASHM